MFARPEKKIVPILMYHRISEHAAFIGSTSRWLRREGETTRPMLTWDQISEISARGIECGGHSHWHRQLDTLPLAVARDEIVQSKRYLEHHPGLEVSSF